MAQCPPIFAALRRGTSASDLRPRSMAAHWARTTRAPQHRSQYGLEPTLDGRTDGRVTGNPYAEVGPLRRVIRQATTLRPLAWASARVLHRVDKVVYRATRGGATFSGWISGLPVVLLTTTGARSGQRRTTPVLGIPAEDRLVIIAANFGKRTHPAWYHNLRAHPTVTVTVAGAAQQYEAVEMTGEERDLQFEQALTLNPGWLRYRTRAGKRSLPVIMLIPHPRT